MTHFAALHGYFCSNTGKASTCTRSVAPLATETGVSANGGRGTASSKRTKLDSCSFNMQMLQLVFVNCYVVSTIASSSINQIGTRG